jgi:hypothetical protein
MGHWVPVPSLAELPHCFPSISKNRVFQIVLTAWRLFCTGGKKSNVTHAAVRRKGFGSATSELPACSATYRAGLCPTCLIPQSLKSKFKVSRQRTGCHCVISSVAKVAERSQYCEQQSSVRVLLTSVSKEHMGQYICI